MQKSPQSQLHPHHRPLEAEFQTTPEGVAKAQAYYNSNSTMVAKLAITDLLPLPNSSIKIPRLGFGIYQSPSKTCITSCLHALKSGYRHIDSAQFYRNEAEMGEAVRQSGIPRSEVFLTTKILTAAGSPEATYKKLLNSVELIDPGDKGYVDLFLIHTASGGSVARKQMWQALEKLVEEGKTKSIGVSNFNEQHIEEMKPWAKICPPQVNQIELHPWCQQRSIVDYCNYHSIIIQAYCPLVRNLKAHNTTLNTVAKTNGVTGAQVLIRYCLQKGWIPLPKSDTPSRIKANADVYGFELSDEDMKTLDDLDQGNKGAIVQAVASLKW